MYLDTAVLIKLLVDEPDTEFFQDALRGAFLSSSELALTEVRSALLAKERDRQISAKQRQSAWAVFQRWIQEKELILHPLNSAVLKKATHVLELCRPSVPLRTLDAIHAAACDQSQDFPLCTTDKCMRDAAQVLGIPLFPPSEPA